MNVVGLIFLIAFTNLVTFVIAYIQGQKKGIRAGVVFGVNNAKRLKKTL